MPEITRTSMRTNQADIREMADWVYSVCVLQVMEIFTHPIEKNGEIFRICYTKFFIDNAPQHANRIYTAD